MKKKKFNIFADADLFRLIVVTIGIFALMASLKPNKYLTMANFSSMTIQLPEIGLYTLALTLVLITGQTDISVVNIGNLAALIGAYILKVPVEKGVTGAGVWGYVAIALVVMIIVGALCGALNGFTVTYFGVPTMLVTMATSSIYKGIATGLTSGEAVNGFPEELLFFGTNTVGGISYAFFLLIIVFAAVAFLINKTKYGIELRFIGSNIKASEYAGIKVNKVLMKTYILAGIISAIAGFEIIARTNNVRYDYGLSYINQALIAAVLGATDPNGGYVRMPCLALGLLAVQFLSSGFNLLRLTGNTKLMAWGGLLILVICFDALMREIKRRKALKEIKNRRREKEATLKV